MDKEEFIESGRYLEWEDVDGDRGFIRGPNDNGLLNLGVHQDGEWSSVYVGKELAKKLRKFLKEDA